MDQGPSPCREVGELTGRRITAQGCDVGACTLAAGHEGDCGGPCRDIWELVVPPPTKLQGLGLRDSFAPELPKMCREIQRTSQRWIDGIIDSQRCFARWIEAHQPRPCYWPGPGTGGIGRRVASPASVMADGDRHFSACHNPHRCGVFNV